MIHFKSPDLKNYRLNEFIQFMKNVVHIIQVNDPVRLVISQKFQVLNDQVVELQQYRNLSTNKHTQMLADLDTRRDQAIICLRSISKSYTYYHQDQIRDAANIILDCIDKHGRKIYDMNYSQETTVISSLVQKFETVPKYKKAIKAIHMQDLVAELKDCNQKFDQLFVDRLIENSNTRSKLSSTDLIHQNTLAYRDLITHLDAQYTLNPTDDYLSVIRHINQNILHFNDLVTRRRQKRVRKIHKKDIT